MTGRERQDSERDRQEEGHTDRRRDRQDSERNTLTGRWTDSRWGQTDRRRDRESDRRGTREQEGQTDGERDGERHTGSVPGGEGSTGPTWLARPCRGPASPFMAAAKARYGSDKALPTRWLVWALTFPPSWSLPGQGGHEDSPSPTKRLARCSQPRLFPVTPPEQPWHVPGPGVGSGAKPPPTPRPHLLQVRLAAPYLWMVR